MQTELNILIVEDIPSDAEAMENELRNGAIRFHAKRVETKAAFLQELQSFSPDLVLSDFSLPEFDALEALEARARERGTDMATLSLAWVLSQPEISTAIVGPRRPEHLEPARRALELRLDEKERAELEGMFS